MDFNIAFNHKFKHYLIHIIPCGLRYFTRNLFITNFCFFIFFNLTPLMLNAEEISFNYRPYSRFAQKLMGYRGETGLFEISLKKVDEFLPKPCKLKRKELLPLAKNITPGKAILKLFRNTIYLKKFKYARIEQYAFFSNLNTNTIYTYAIVKNRLIFSESTKNNDIEKAKDSLSKHFFISGMKKSVKYAGEFIVLKNPNALEIFVIFDNNSGTYKPKSKGLGRLQQLLQYNFAPKKTAKFTMSKKRVFFLTRSFDTSVDKNKLYAQQKNPFIKNMPCSNL